jgi:hypothetical protein
MRTLDDTKRIADEQERIIQRRIAEATAQLHAKLEESEAKLKDLTRAAFTAIRILSMPGSPPPGGLEMQLVVQAGDAREPIDGQQHRLHNYELRLSNARSDAAAMHQAIRRQERERAVAILNDYDEEGEPLQPAEVQRRILNDDEDHEDGPQL